MGHCKWYSLSCCNYQPEKLYFLGRIITLPKIPDVVKAVMKSRLVDLFEGDNSSPHGLHDIVCLLEKYELCCFDSYACYSVLIISIT